ncbi:SIR2 family protein [Rhizobium sp. LjRoot258]|uniref:SIR2 family protein n=1 Tax=Rhizobium sp. LjRoot258 TaxID=3342299 RepID=UPI003ECCF9C8
MAANIELLPTIPDGIREAATRGVLVPFVGAGASLLAGCPSWNQFAGRALRALLNSGGFSYAQLAQLEHLSPRVKISIALGMQRDGNRTIDFRELLSPSQGYENPMGRRIYGALSGIAQTFVTTNYDEWLDNELAPSQNVTSKSPKGSALPPSRARKVYHKIEDLTPDRLSEPGVFHIHGSLLDPAGMIMTTSDYLRHYANDHHDTRPGRENRLLTFLEHLFQRKTVLFVGYGLEELEILEYVVTGVPFPRCPSCPNL